MLLDILHTHATYEGRLLYSIPNPCYCSCAMALSAAVYLFATAGANDFESQCYSQL